MTRHGARSSMREAPVPETIAEAARLLRHLGEPGHAAVTGSLTPDRVILSSTRNGISLGRGTVSAAAAELLTQRGLVRETSPGTLTLTDAGRAAAGRLPEETAGKPGDDAASAALPARTPRRKAKGGARGDARGVAGTAAAGPDRVIGEAVLRDGAESVKVAINEAESPLAWLHRRRDRNGEPFIDATCFEAGERLRRDMTMARIMPRVTSRWSPAGGGSGGPAVATDAMVSARQRLNRALEAVDGDYAGILLDVCGFLKRIEDVERERHWPPRSGKVVLKLALQRLAAHYGLAREARGADGARRIRSWQAC
ncbi:DUF6456 domain-containing protein [Pseudochelatococcus sp. B33]